MQINNKWPRDCMSDDMKNMTTVEKTQVRLLPTLVTSAAKHVFKVDN